MKNLLLTILIILIIPLHAAAQISTADTLSAVENSIFGYDYVNESNDRRVERIEEHLYGNKKSGNIQSRLENITNDTGIVITEKTKPQKQADNMPQINPLPPQPSRTAQNAPDPSIKEDSSVEYPMVDKLEETVFNKTYKTENIYARLDRLEEKVFSQKSNSDLNKRVDNLVSAVQPKRPKNSRQQPVYTAQDIENYYSNSGLDPVNNQSLPFQLAALEQDILKSDYMNDNTSKRLSRLEEKLFNRTFVNDSDTTRLQRIMVAYDAKKQSYMYENNKKMQNMAAMSQIGGILLMILAILL